MFSPLADQAFQDHDSLAMLHKVVAFIQKSFDALQHALPGSTVDPHFVEKCATPPLIPMIEGGVDFFLRPDPHEVPGLKSTRISSFDFVTS